METNKSRHILTILAFTLLLILGFWWISRYPALNSKAAMSGMDAFEDPLTHQPHFSVPLKGSLSLRVFYTTLNWYEANWRGMVFGLALAASFLTLLGYLPKRKSNQRFKNSFIGLFVGTPLGVCVNCVAPIAKGLYEGGSKMETALAVMFSSPTMNIVILTMLFSIFPFYMAILKLFGTLLLVLVIVPFLSEKDNSQSEVCHVDPTYPAAGTFETKAWATTLQETTKDYGKSLNYIVVRTVPLMFLAGFLGALLSHLWKFEFLIGLPVSFKMLALVSFMGTFFPLPIAFDLMLTHALMMSGMSEGFAMAILFTLGTFSIYSAMIVSRTFSLKLAVGLYLLISLMGIGLGFAADSYAEYRYVKWLEHYETFVNHKELKLDPQIPFSVKSSPAKTSEGYYPTARRVAVPFWNHKDISIKSIAHKPRKRSGKKYFQKITGPELGISFSNRLTPETFFDPLFFGRGIAGGDLNGDNWTDIAIATDNGPEIYQNINGKQFKKIEIAKTGQKKQQSLNIALADFNNDGILDIYYTVFGDGNFLRIGDLNNPQAARIFRVPNQDALVTSAIALGDWNRDGFLDIVNGNYFLGNLTRTPIDRAINQRIINRNLRFTLEILEGIPGQTHTALLSDWNDDGWPDLMIGNDYRVSDTYYMGQSNGTLQKILRRDGIIPITTENTMSMDTADFNNDLILDLYLANIGFSRGFDVVANIFGETMKNVGLAFCRSGGSVLDTTSCHDLLKLVTLLNPEILDISEHCDTLQNSRNIRECMVARLAIFATKRKNPKLCEKISDNTSLSNKWCKVYFQAKRLKIKTLDEIPLQTFSNILLKGTSEGLFEDISEETGIGMGEWSWNAKFADLDNDEWQDIYVVNGAIVTQEFTTNSFFHNRSGEGFEKVEANFGLDDYDHSSSYTYIDWDNDGDLDIIANTLYGPFKIYLNNEDRNNSLTFKLRDRLGNKFCVGCKVVIHYGPNGERHQIREIKMGGGFHSFDAPVVHFGLGKFELVKRVEIFWSTGERTFIDQIFPANHEYRIYRNEPKDRI